MMKAARYFKVIEHDRIIGGLILFQREHGTVELDRVFIEPECQNRGIGGELLRFAEGVFPETKRLVLDTPSWNLRTQHFYEQGGYVKIGEIDSGEGFLLFQYEKKLEA